MTTTSKIEGSGNSSVTVVIDTTPIAYALLFCHNSGKVSPDELNRLVDKFEEMLHKHHSKSRNSNRSSNRSRSRPLIQSGEAKVSSLGKRPYSIKYELAPLKS